MINIIKKIPDNELVLKVKNEGCSDSFDELLNRHQLLFFSTVHKYHKKHDYTNINDLLDDLYIVFNKAIQTFNPSKKTKFSTFLSHVTYWHCLNSNKLTKKTILCENKDIDIINESNQHYYTFNENLDELNDYIFSILNQMRDKRIANIYRLRFIETNEKNKLLTWRQIGSKLNMSPMTAISLYKKGKKFLAFKLNSKILSERI